jgi:hypothetical protein
MMHVGTVIDIRWNAAGGLTLELWTWPWPGDLRRTRMDVDVRADVRFGDEVIWNPAEDSAYWLRAKDFAKKDPQHVALRMLGTPYEVTA